MEFFYDTAFPIPAAQIALLLLLSTGALLYGRIRLALLINYVFAIHWGYFSNSELFFQGINNFELFTLLYYGIGIGSAMLAMIGFLYSSRG